MPGFSGFFTATYHFMVSFSQTFDFGSGLEGNVQLGFDFKPVLGFERFLFAAAGILRGLQVVKSGFIAGDFDGLAEGAAHREPGDDCGSGDGKGFAKQDVLHTVAGLEEARESGFGLTSENDDFRENFIRSKYSGARGGHKRLTRCRLPRITRPWRRRNFD